MKNVRKFLKVSLFFLLSGVAVSAVAGGEGINTGIIEPGFGGIPTADLDLDGTWRLIFDTDGDTYSESTSDDEVEIWLGGQQEARWLINPTNRGNLNLFDNNRVSFGSGVDAAIQWASAGDPDTLLLGLSPQSNTFHVVERLDMDIATNHTLETNPTVLVHSADMGDPNQYLRLTHDQTDGVIQAGAGDVKLDDNVHVTGNLVVDGSLTGAAILDTASFPHNTGPAGEHYVAGFYNAPVTDANLTQASLTVVLGTADIGYGAHAFIVSAAAGAKDAGTCTLVLTGTTITDAGVRNDSASIELISDVATETTDKYTETTEKWIGQVTYTLTLAGGATTCNLDFNYGYAKYYDHGNRDFTIDTMNCKGEGGATDTIDIELLKHGDVGWTYHASAFVPGNSALAQWSTDYVNETGIVSGLPFAYKRSGLGEAITGSGLEGYVIRLTTGTNNSIESVYCNVTVSLD